MLCARVVLSVFVVVAVLQPVCHGSPTPTAKSVPLELIILHNNDMHARFDQTDKYSSTCDQADIDANVCYGGFARVSTKLKEYRKKAAQGGTPVLYLNAGDTYTGTPWFTLYTDQIVTEFLNLLKPDAVSLGNHEFDLGVEGLVPYLNAAEHPVLIANMDATHEPTLQNTTSLSESTTFNVNGVNVGVIGYLTPETEFLAPPTGVLFTDEIEAINKESAILKARGVNIIIALGHSGLDVDKLIAEHCADVDLVIGGHSHTFLYTGTAPDIDIAVDTYPVIVQQARGKRVPVVQAYAFTKYLGYLHLNFDANGNLVTFDGSPILLDALVQPDPEVLSVLEKYRPGVIAMQNEVIGKSVVFLNGTCRFSECNLGNFIADAVIFDYARRYEGEYWTDAAIALVNGGDIRTSLDVGNVTVYDMTTTLPFGTPLVTIEVTGSELKMGLENSVHRYDGILGRGEFLQMSGVQVVYNLTKPANERVESVLVRCASCSIPSFAPLELTRTYKIIISSFLQEGGDGFTMFKKPYTLLGVTEYDSTRIYFGQLQTIYPSIEWRITMHGDIGSGGAGLQLSIVITLLSAVVGFMWN